MAQNDGNRARVSVSGIAPLSRLYFVTMDGASRGPVEQVEAACRAGIRWIQLRMKEATDEEVLEAAREARRICEAWGAVLIVNDRVEVAAASGAHGVHLGLEDMPVGAARRLLGENRIIGGTANTVGDIREHARQGADYIGLGPFRHTTTKKKLSPVLGVEGYRLIMSQLRVEGLSVPVVAIGGIVAEDVGTLLDAGLYGVAFSGMLAHAADWGALVRQLEEEIKKYEHADHCR
jgi:thiamine-phosphate pyrophosphorylase